MSRHDEPHIETSHELEETSTEIKNGLLICLLTDALRARVGGILRHLPIRGPAPIYDIAQVHLAQTEFV